MKAIATYQDGTTKEANVGPKAHVMTERYFDKSMSELFDVSEGKFPRVECAYYMVWAALSCTGQEKADDYEGWLDKISDATVDVSEEEEQQAQQGKASPKTQSQKKSST